MFIDPTTLPDQAQDIYGDEYFNGADAGYPDYLQQAKLLRKHGRRYGSILKKYLTPGNVLDIGAASGFILQGLIDMGWHGDGLEINDSMAQYGRTQLGLSIMTGTLERFTAHQKYDLLSMIQVLPHFFDLHSALEAACEATQSGGYWLIETWNRDSWTAKIFKQHWHEYSPPSVLRWFSPTDLQTLLQHYGFNEVARGRPKKWVQVSHATSLLNFKAQDMGNTGKLIQSLLKIIPQNFAIPYPSEDLFWALYKKSG